VCGYHTSKGYRQYWSMQNYLWNNCHAHPLAWGMLRLKEKNKKRSTNKNFPTRFMIVFIILFSWQLELSGQWAIVNNVECRTNACHSSCNNGQRVNGINVLVGTMFACSHTQRRERVWCGVSLGSIGQRSSVNTVWILAQVKMPFS
jgi:hypothetical protein